MTEFARRLAGQRHYESREIKEREKSVMQRRGKVKRNAGERRSKLEDCRKLMVFLQDCNEVRHDMTSQHIHILHIPSFFF